MSAAAEHLHSPTQYLALERAATVKSGLVNGRIYAMVGASPIHNRIASNLMWLLGSVLRSGTCQPYGSDQRVSVPLSGFYTYPDLSVASAPEEYDREDPHTLTNPSVLIEILCSSTEAYDRGAKFGHYRRFVSLREYWLVSTQCSRVERFVRQDDMWTFEVFEGLESAIPFWLAPATPLSLAEIYHHVELPGE